MIEHLRAAATARHDACQTRARLALEHMIRDGAPVSFQAVARRAQVSTDFLYNDPALRTRIEQLRGSSPPSKRDGDHPSAIATNSTSGVVRALTEQLKQMRAQHHREITRLRDALAAAHGENLELRRELDQARLHQSPAPAVE